MDTMVGMDIRGHNATKPAPIEGTRPTMAAVNGNTLIAGAMMMISVCGIAMVKKTFPQPGPTRLPTGRRVDDLTTMVVVCTELRDSYFDLELNLCKQGQ